MKKLKILAILPIFLAITTNLVSAQIVEIEIVDKTRRILGPDEDELQKIFEEQRRFFKKRNKTIKYLEISQELRVYVTNIEPIAVDYPKNLGLADNLVPENRLNNQLNSIILELVGRCEVYFPYKQTSHTIDTIGEYFSNRDNFLYQTIEVWYRISGNEIIQLSIVKIRKKLHIDVFFRDMSAPDFLVIYPADKIYSGTIKRGNKIVHNEQRTDVKKIILYLLAITICCSS